MRRLFVLAAAAALVRPAPAGEIVLPGIALERDAPVAAVYRTNARATGRGTLELRWTDSHGRVVDERKLPVELTDETDIGFTLDLRRAAAMKNRIDVRFTFDGKNQKGEPDKRNETAGVSFIARPPDRRWWDYAVIMWQQHSPSMFRALTGLGINGGQYLGRNRPPADFLLDNDLRWYAENIATDFYAAYHRWFPDRPVNWAFREAKELYKKDPGNKEAFKRHPSLSDRDWLERIRARLVEAARAHSPYRPFFYDLGDESGIADLAAFWDFDFSDLSLGEMRRWLAERYGTLAALNRQWETTFDRWEHVVPPTTNEAMKRAGDNFSGWADFKEWMDVAFERALRWGADAVHSVDPDAYVAIAGGQMPGWGGYDYARITAALDAIEPYDIGANIEIIRSLRPDMPAVTTSFASGPWEKHRVWYELLHGSRGLILWDDKSQYVDRDGNVQKRGAEAAPYYNEIRSGLGALVACSRSVADPIAIHYSQASMRTEWMLYHRPKGEAWMARTSSSEYKDSPFLKLRESYCRAIEDQGLQYRFVSYGQLAGGELARGGYRVLFLPRSSALSAEEAAAVREFVASGGTAIADCTPGAFDEHSRRLARPQLEDLFGGPHEGAVTRRRFGRGAAIHLNVDAVDYRQLRLQHKEEELHRVFGGLLESAGIRPRFVVRESSGTAHPVGVETHVFSSGAATVVAFLTNPELRISDLGPAEFRSNERFERRRTLAVTLPEEAYVVDVRAGKSLGRRKEVQFELEPYEPAIFSLEPSAPSPLRVSLPEAARRGDTVRIGLAVEGAWPRGMHIFHIDVVDPAGRAVPYYSGNVQAPGGRAEKLLPLAASDAAGQWQIKARDVLTGQSAAVALAVQ